MLRRNRQLLAPANCTNCAAGQTPLGQGGVVPGGPPNAFSPPATIPGGDVTNPKAVKNAAFDGVVTGAVQSAAAAKAGVVAAVTGALQHVVQSKEARACRCVRWRRVFGCSRKWRGAVGCERQGVKVATVGEDGRICGLDGHRCLRFHEDTTIVQQ